MHITCDEENSWISILLGKETYQYGINLIKRRKCIQCTRTLRWDGCGDNIMIYLWHVKTSNSRALKDVTSILIAV